MHPFTNLLKRGWLLLIVAAFCLNVKLASAAFTSVSLAGSLTGATLETQINLADPNASGQDTITVRYTVPQTSWLAVGVNPAGTMPNGEVVIGKPDDNNSVRKYKITARGAGAISEQPNQTLINPSLQQTGGNTVLTFTKLLVEDGEFTITAAASNTFIAAFGSSNTFSYHQGFGSQAVTLDDGSNPGPDASPTPPPTTAAPVPTNPPTTAAPFEAPTNPPGADVLELTGDLQGSSLSYQFTFGDPNTGDKDSITVTYTAPVTAWVGVGASESGFMLGSTAIIGLPSTGEVKKYSLNAKTTPGVSVMPDDQQTLVNVGITQANGFTTLTYTKILVEDGEVPINRVGDNIFVAAHGSSNTLGYHSVRGSFSLSGKAVGRDNSLWIAHGCLAYVAWGVICPLAILAGLLRKWIPGGPSMWYEIHRTLQSLVVLLTLIAIIIAIVALNQDTPDNSSAGHFQPDFSDSHRTIGLAVLIVAIFQVTGGVLRPHLPESDDEKMSTKRKVWEVLHRLLGTALLLLAWYQIDLGIFWYHEIFDNGNQEPTASVFYAVMGIFAFIILMAISLKIMCGGD
ncbi:unnamed protein product [Cylindrotheca closterium]|uniref:Cytochrome b561 domain-containing protein n=1 Tax=Cylindrotheca closterium TaxID=2856 RepID=A0AAD2G5C9_9STRA|nr:unnamed protein product [Cylindrotheca closterium]